MTQSSAELDRYLDEPFELLLEHLVLPTGRVYADVATPWQRSFFAAIFGRHGDGRPVHRLVYDERRRGESKTEDMAAAATVDLLVGPRRHRSYAVAGDKDQAALVLDSIQGFIGRSAILRELDVQKSTVINTATDAELRVISSDDRTAFGIRPRRVYFDELSLQPDDRLWTAMWSAIGKSDRAQLVAVSMAGWDFASIGWKVRELARTNAAYYFATRQGSDLAPWLSAADVEEQRLTLHPAEFARLWECRWTEPLGAWITREMYDAAEGGEEGIRGDGRSRYAGFVDVGLVRDPTAIAVCHLEGDRVVLDTLRTLHGSRSANVELEVVEDLVGELSEQFGVRRWIFEAPQAVASVQRLQRMLRGATVEARYPTSETQAQLFGTLYRLFANHQLVLFPHEQLRKETLNLVTKTVGGRLKVLQQGSVHQDHVIALGGAADMLMAQPKKLAMPSLPLPIGARAGASRMDVHTFPLGDAVDALGIAHPGGPDL